ncbi:MAG TPA: DNA translocase FtsK [Amnibacterium sp.]|jgi:DNA segregation ATPase FtsK/SpoIIIE-like protein|nr:DNA translocase FtsK [Amnibacterium sp.]
MLQLTSHPRRTAALLLAGFAAVAALLVLWWPAGTVLGLAAGGFAVHRIGTEMQRGADAQQWADLQQVAAWLADEHGGPAQAVREPAPVPAPVLRDEVRAQLTGLKTRLGDDYPDFARAARLVVETQYASAARLQRELQVPYSRARRLLTDLEQQHFVGPATGSLPRQVLMPKDRLPELEAVLAA